LATKEELFDLQQAFTAMDENRNGFITRKEMIRGFNAETEEEIKGVENIFAEIDIDDNGTISYSEWLTASVDTKSLLTKEKLENAFNIFDKDGGGTITIEEIKNVLVGEKNKDVDDGVWEHIVAEVDDDGNGEIDFLEFCVMMHKLVQHDSDESESEK
jgi:calcium-dependent protein kinase